LAYVDTITLDIQSGNGGNGHISFRREKYVAKGGPDGGDGGVGGDVIFVASKKISTFLDLSANRIYKAEHGDHGRPRKQSGKRGKDCIIYVPCGTIIFDNATNTRIKDLTEDTEQYTLLHGGKGGKGNPHFCTSRIQAPRKATPGKPGKQLNITLELNVMADVGLVGHPNAGKSTLLKTLTQANPKIANYPFTTLHPNLGIFRRFDKEIVIADIPGIIEGAAQGVGLGNEFLRHISRTSTLLFLIEPNPEIIEEAFKTFSQLCDELNEYSNTLLKEKKVLVSLNKVDLLSDNQIECIQKEFSKLDIELIPISCYTRQGIEGLEQRIHAHV